MRDRPVWDDSNRSRWAILAVVAVFHGLLVLLALHWVVRIGPRSERALVLLVLPNRPAVPPPTLPERATPNKKPPLPADTAIRLAPVPATPAQSPPPAPIDWAAEADFTVKRQEQLAAATGPRALDHRGAGMDINGGLGAHQKGTDFAWDRKHTNRVEVTPGAVVVHISDHCILVFFPFPFAFCGIGKIPVRGDLLDHMRDEPQSQIDQKNIAP